MTKERIEELLEEFREPERDDVAVFHELYDIALEKTAKLSALEARDRWRTVERDGVPEDEAEVEFMLLGGSRAHLGEADLLVGDPTIGGYPLSFVLCYRPAREVGELPVPKEEA